MPTVSHAFAFRPRPGHLDAFLKELARINAFVKRAGGRMRAWNEVSGSNPGAIGVVIENDDWKGYGAYRSKLDADPEFQKLRAEISSRKDPLAEFLASAMSEEVPS